MTMKEITDGLKTLLSDNHYNPITIQFYEREWKKIQVFLLAEYGDEGFDMERGLAYLEKQYGFQTRYNDGTLSQQRVQLLRVVHMLEDYRLHQVLTRRYYASKNPIRLNPYYAVFIWAIVMRFQAQGSQRVRSVIIRQSLWYLWITFHKKECDQSALSAWIPVMDISGH